MLGLTLRQEFRSQKLKGTSIELSTAIQVAAKDFLEITYPSRDLIEALKVLDPAQGKITVLLGERGQGKSHIMAALYHALTDSGSTKNWLDTWAVRLNDPRISTLPVRQDLHVITESLHRQSYKFLWDLVFERHPNGEWARGKWEGLGLNKTDIPSLQVMLDLFQKKPTALILDEYQTWFDGLTNTKQYPWRTWAFNFVQILSDIAREHPDVLTLILSVRNGSTDAFQQVHKFAPKIVDFKGPTAQKDRQKLLLHRLFENRMQVSESAIRDLIQAHVFECFRLKETSSVDHAKHWDDFIQAWPFSPDLLQLLEDQVLIATYAQETRDLIRILVDLFKRSGDTSPIVTAADFRLDDEDSGVEALLNSVSVEEHRKLRDKAQRNLTAVRDAVKDPDKTIPNLPGIVGALWVRSLATGNQAGAEPDTIQIDITKTRPIDDNAFKVELDTIVDNSFNIHPEGNRLVFKEEENPRAKLLATAKNDKLWEGKREKQPQPGEEAGGPPLGDKQRLAGRDKEHLAKEIRYVLAGADGANKSYLVVVLPESWSVDPWNELEEAEQPSGWDDRLLFLVIPESLDNPGAQLGAWLKQHVQERRNTIRFLIPSEGSPPVYTDRDLLICARAVVLAQEWASSNRAYDRLKTEYQRMLRDYLKSRFDRFAILETWNFTDPTKCAFHLERHKEEGAKIPETVTTHIQKSLFIPEVFESFVLRIAENNDSVRKLIRELQEPRPNGEECIPWLGEVEIKEKLIRLCAQGKIALNVKNSEILQLHSGEDEEPAWRRMKGKLGSGRDLENTYILLPQAVPHTGGVLPLVETPLFPTTTGGVPILGGSQTPAPIPGTSPPGSPVQGSIFSEGEVQLSDLQSPPTSSLNLLGRVEQWGISTGTKIQDLTVHVDHLTGAQLNDLLKKLPDGMTYELRLKKEES